MTPTITIDELNEADNHRDYLLLLEQLTVTNPDKVTAEDFGKQLAVIKTNPYHKIFVARLNDLIIGSITVLIEPKMIRDLSFTAHIEDVVVDKNYRQHGIGRKLVEHAVEYSRNSGCYKIILDCSEANSGFYEKFGFVKKELQMANYLI